MESGSPPDELAGPTSREVERVQAKVALARQQEAEKNMRLLASKTNVSYFASCLVLPNLVYDVLQTFERKSFFDVLVQCHLSSVLAYIRFPRSGGEPDGLLAPGNRLRLSNLKHIREMHPAAPHSPSMILLAGNNTEVKLVHATGGKRLFDDTSAQPDPSPALIQSPVPHSDLRAVLTSSPTDVVVSSVQELSLFCTVIYWFETPTSADSGASALGLWLLEVLCSDSSGTLALLKFQTTTGLLTWHKARWLRQHGDIFIMSAEVQKADLRYDILTLGRADHTRIVSLRDPAEPSEALSPSGVGRLKRKRDEQLHLSPISEVIRGLYSTYAAENSQLTYLRHYLFERSFYRFSALRCGSESYMHPLLAASVSCRLEVISGARVTSIKAFVPDAPAANQGHQQWVLIEVSQKSHPAVTMTLVGNRLLVSCLFPNEEFDRSCKLFYANINPPLKGYEMYCYMLV